ncbi:unnamed protein product, partial [Allacma fusca]
LVDSESTLGLTSWNSLILEVVTIPVAASCWGSTFRGKLNSDNWSRHKKVRRGIKKGRDVIVDIQSDHVKVSLAASPNEYIVNGKLTSPVVKDESYWNLTPGEAIYIWLQKAQEKWWTALIEGEEPIDMKDIEPVRPMEDLPEDEQQKIQELMWNHEQKQKGLPTSDEMRMHDILKKAWDAEGSPFKGTPFDPSKVQLTPRSPDLPHDLPGT